MIPSWNVKVYEQKRCSRSLIFVPEEGLLMRPLADALTSTNGIRK